MEVFKFIEFLQEFKDLYTKEEYKELLALWREDYNKYLLGLIGEDWYLTQFINFSNPILNNTPTTPQ